MVGQGDGLVSNVSLATIMWFTVLIGKPFALQYAQRGMPKERWNDAGFIRGCQVHHNSMGLPDDFCSSESRFLEEPPGYLSLPGSNFDLTLLNIVVGLTYNTILKGKNGCNANLPIEFHLIEVSFFLLLIIHFPAITHYSLFESS